MYYKIQDILGKCCGARLKTRGENDNYIVFSLLIEDDGNWNEKNFQVSAFWIDDLIKVLTETKKQLNRNFRKDTIGGYIL